MSEIRPFSAIRYAGRDLETRLAPPYDVLEQADKAALLERDALNFVKIDLPHVPPKHAGPPEAYAAARQSLDDWLQDGTLTRDAQPAIYVYHQAFEYAGRPFTRKMFFARLRIVPFGEGVYPHEQTFGGPKEDRLHLTRSTRCNLSPIFGLYEDQSNQVAKTLEPHTAGPPVNEGPLDGTTNRLWAVSDPDTVAAVCGLLAEKPVYIADGHHRYGTAMMYREQAIAENGGPLPEDHPANYVLCVFCAMSDPGLLILPTHRVLTGRMVKLAALQSDAELEVTPMPGLAPAEVPMRLAQFGPQAVALHTPDGVFAIRPRRAELLDGLVEDHSPAWRRLGLAFLHAYLLDRCVTPQGGAPEISYVKAADAAVRLADETSGSAFLMQASTMEEMCAVCLAGDLMPQKSTFFYPKLASGLVVNPLS